MSRSSSPPTLIEGNSSKLDSFDGEAFDAASIINLDSGKLVDVLADKDFVSMSPKNTSVLPLAPANESRESFN